MSVVVLKVDYGGLGDHLFFSPIPRMLKEYGGVKYVYLSENSQIRNIQTFDLIWKKNPYLDGLTSELPTKTFPESRNFNKVMNIALSRYGLTNYEYELFPEIYADIRTDERYLGKKYIDLNYISFCGAFTFYDAILILRKRPNLILVNPSFILRIFSRNKFVITSSLVDYASLIYSSSCFSAVTSGGASLASALKKRCIVYYGYGHIKVYRHGNNKNIMIGGSGVLRKFISWIYIKKNSIKVRFNKYFSKESTLGKIIADCDNT
jgi:hypothetical protein